MTIEDVIFVCSIPILFILGVGIGRLTNPNRLVTHYCQYEKPAKLPKGSHCWACGKEVK